MKLKHHQPLKWPVLTSAQWATRLRRYVESVDSAVDIFESILNSSNNDDFAVILFSALHARACIVQAFF